MKYVLHLKCEENRYPSFILKFMVFIISGSNVLLQVGF